MELLKNLKEISKMNLVYILPYVLCHIGRNLRKALCGGAHGGVSAKQLNLIGNSAKNEVQIFFFMFRLRLESTSIEVYSE